MIGYSELIEWLDPAELQKMQESFSEITGMSSVTIDMDGNRLSRTTGSSDYCDLLSTSSGSFKRLCTHGRIYGAKEAASLGHGTYYFATDGLIEFSAPIIIDGEIIACLVGGMVFEYVPEEERIKALAKKLMLDPEKLWKAAKKTPVCSIESVEKAAKFLYDVAAIVAGTATSRIQMDKAAKELARASRMQNDFVANMSHEIRTPMNAVIGMADIALQAEMSPEAQEYVSQIRISGQSLLHIVNDILDYSKISAGKMDIFEDRYDLALLVRNSTNIITNRLRGKENEIAFLLDIHPSTPRYLYGDPSRIQQVLVNICNNAVKFTNKGYIKVSIRAFPLDDDHVTLSAKVTDTGIGIKPQDRSKLFRSFTQVDSKRNRNVEGTGLGLAIVKQLVTLMHGTVDVDSTYGVGSTFTLEIPQRVAERAPFAKIENPSNYAVIGFFSNSHVAHNFRDILDMENVAVDSFVYDETAPRLFERWFADHEMRKCFFFTDERSLERGIFKDIDLSAPRYKEIRPRILAEPFTEGEPWKDIPRIVVVKKPFCPLKALESIEIKCDLPNAKDAVPSKKAAFSAPDAKILVVDDNKVNLRVAQKMLEMFETKVDRAYSGKEAMELISNNKYDLIFMDHMMPELDGVDTTRLIRRFHPEMSDVPIIALTANAVDEVRALFLSEGMNDFIAKPIELNILSDKLKTWLPKGKIREENKTATGA